MAKNARLDAELQKKWQSHLANKNGHSIRKQQLGLKGVNNLPLGTDNEIALDKAANRYMSPGALAVFFDKVLFDRGLIDADGNLTSG